MRTYSIEGGLPLRGDVSIQGAKNAAQKILPATIVFPGTYVLKNVPIIQDSAALFSILTFLGAEVTFLGEHTVWINTEQIVTKEIPPDVTATSTGTFLFAGALLSRCGEVKIWHPGGDNIGKRPVAWHLDAFRGLGATVVEEQAYYHIRATHLNGCTIPFVKPTANGAVNAIMASVRAQGETIINNVAPEPEIQNVVEFLRAIGAKVAWTGEKSLRVEGVDQGRGSGEIAIIPDRNDAATFLIASALGQGPVTLHNIREDHVLPLLDVLQRIGVHFERHEENEEQRSLTVQREVFSPVDLQITSRPYPGFSTDWGPMMQVLMTQVPGTGVFHETIFSHRFAHVEELVKMGAIIEYVDFPVDEGAYNFERVPGDDDGRHAIKTQGPTQFHGASVHANDVRAGAALVLAGLVAQGTTQVTGVEQIERGYEAFVERLRHVGASIKEV